MNASHQPKFVRRTALTRVFAVGTVLTAAALALSGCSLSPASSTTAETLTIGIWKGYGADLPWVAKAFKKETGATIKFQYIDSEQNLIDLMQKSKGGIDVGLPNVQYVGQGIDKGVFHALDTSKLTNYKNIYASFSGLSELRKGGDLYGIPWTWGSTGLFYSAKAFPTAPTSLSVLSNPKYKGKTALIDDPNVEVPIAALELGQNAQKPNMTTVTPELQKLKDNSKLLYSSTDDLAKAISNGSVVAGIGNSDTIGGIAASNPDLKYTIASNGAVGWIDNWTMSADTTKVALAYKWINYMTSSAFLKKWADTPSDASPAPANESVVESLSAATRTRLQTYPDKISDLALQLPEPDATLQSWQDAWTKVKAG